MKSEPDSTDRIDSLERDVSRLTNDINSIGGKVGTMAHDIARIESQHVGIQSDIKLIQRDVTEHVRMSKERDAEMKDKLDKFDDKLSRHMEGERNSMKELLQPIESDLAGLYSRWWGVAVATVGILGTGFVSSIVYIFISATGSK